MAGPFPHGSSFSGAAYGGMVIDHPVMAVLGPTNTGKTHFALERMSAHPTGMIGLPLRLLAREVYEKMVDRKGPRAVALVTGEEKITPPNPAYWVCTVEAMPLERKTSFLAIDEVQLAADPERGRIFTERLLYARGQHETLLLGSDTMAPILRRMIPDIGFVGRERFSQLDFVGHKKVTRLPRRTAIVAFSAEAVYSIAELIRRQRGGAAVVMGALSPRTRNAQAALYNEGEVDYLVATDAIGMGLNMDIDHVAFAGGRKFDGRNARALFPAEVAQIAGRAGRHVRDGTWGTTADCGEFHEDTVEQVQEHRFDPVTALQWRSQDLTFSSLPALLKALERKAPRPELVRARMDDDEDALRRLARRHDIRDTARGGAALKLLWEVCQVPDFRKVTPDNHAAMLGELYHQLMEKGQIPEFYTASQLQRLDRIDGDVDTLSNRIAHVRTWTYLSHRPGWLEQGAHWQEEARRIEDALSDALHEKLTQRFIDRRTSVLLKKLKDDVPLLAGVTADGEVIVEGEFVGRLLGFQFILDPRAKGPHAKAVRFAALKALKPELATRAAALAAAQFHEFSLRDGGAVWWRQSVVAQLSRGPQPLRPDFKLVAMEHLPPASLPQIEEKVREFIADRVEGLIGPLVSLQKAVNEVSDSPEALSARARGVAFQIIEHFGAISRREIAGDIKALDQDERAKLRKLGVRFGEYTIHMPTLLKPAPAQFLTQLWALWEGKELEGFETPQAGATSVANDKTVPAPLYLASGYRPSGARAVRIDMLERLAGEIRTARNEGDKDGFEASPKMMSLVGASGEDFETILQSLGFRKHTKTVSRPKIKLKPKAEKKEAAAENGEGAAVEAGAQPVPSAAEGSTGDSPSPETNAVNGSTAPSPAPTGDEAPRGSDAEPAAGAPASEAPIEDATAQGEASPETPSASADTPQKTDGDAESAAPLIEEAQAPSPIDGTATAETTESAAEASPQSTDAAPVETAHQSTEDSATATDATAESPVEPVEMEEVEVTLWRWAPPKPKGDRGHQGKRGRDGAGKGQHAKGGKPQGKGKRPPKGKGPQKDRGPRTFTAGPKKDRKEIDPDNPFAVLAALKDKN